MNPALAKNNKLNMGSNLSKGWVKVIIKNLQKIIPINQKKIQKAALKVLSFEGVKLTGEITILFIGDKQIQELNLLYLGFDRPTDVISFDSSLSKKEFVFDIAISVETALRNSRRFKSRPEDEILRYVIHGLLHLLGYNDNNKTNRLRMCKIENYLLSATSHQPRTTN